LVSEKGPEIVTLPKGSRVPLEAPSALSLAEEQRTANLIAVLALGEDAWANLYGAGADEDAADLVAAAIVERLGLSS